MSSSAASSMVATLGSVPSSVATASESLSRAAAWFSALKIGRISAPSSPCWSLRACPRQSLRKCTVQRCQGAPSTLAIAFFSPSWASEMTSCTPTRPRGDQALDELRPERLGLGGADVQRDDLPPAGLVHAVSDDHALAHHAAAVSDLLDLAVEEQIGVAGL